jgi:hypothetical protein
MFVLELCEAAFPIEEDFRLQLFELRRVFASLPVRLLRNAEKEKLALL